MLRFMRPVCSGAIYCSVPSRFSGATLEALSCTRAAAIPKSVSCVESVWINQNIGWFYVFVDDVLRMNAPERVGELTRNFKKRTNWQRPTLEIARKRDAAGVWK